MIRTILIRDDTKYKVSMSHGIHGQCSNCTVTPQVKKVITRSPVQETTIFRKVYDLATENIRSLDFEPIR